MATVTFIDPIKGSLKLVQKYQKMVDSGRLLGVSLEFGAGGSINVFGVLPPDDEGGQPTKMAILDAISSTEEETTAQPWEQERKFLVDKFERRLDVECPVALTQAASKAAFDAAMAAVPFPQRRAFNLSNKEFATEYARFENGTPIRRSVEEVAALKAAELASKAPARGGMRGRGRGGRGRGASFQAPATAPATAPQQGA